jgi:hypothetical protein
MLRKPRQLPYERSIPGESETLNFNAAKTHAGLRESLGAPTKTRSFYVLKNQIKGELN